MKYQCILFDMDGTLIDSYEGIFCAYQRALQKMKLPFSPTKENRELVRNAVGAPLPEVFQQRFQMEPEQAERAVRYYREYYGERGKEQVCVYEGIPRLLKELKGQGRFIGAATLKKEAFAAEILKAQGLLSYFDAVCGMDEGDGLSKAQLIQRGRKLAKAKKEQTLLIGDSPYDEKGAREAGVDFLAVSYGFGFGKGKAPKRCVFFAGSPKEILEFLHCRDREKKY